MGRLGMTPEEALAWPRDQVVGLMSHLATADEPDETFARQQIEAFGALAAEFDGVPRHLANSAAALRFPEARHDAVRCGVALYGLSPFGGDPAERRPRARHVLAQLRRAGEDARGGREHGLRPPVHRRGSDPDRDRPGRLRGRVPARPDRDRGAGGRDAAPGGRHGVHGLVRRRARRRAGGRAGDDPRRRRARRGARPRPRDDQLRDHVRDPARRKRYVRTVVDG